VNPGRPRVLIAGGGVAGLETVLALRALAEDRVDVTIVAPELRFVNRSMAVDQPFKRQRVRGIRLEVAAAELGARWHRGTLDRVEHAQRRVVTRDGDELPYDALVLAVVKQGGLAAQQADAVAEAIAASAGADVDPRPFRPVLRGVLMTGGSARYMRSDISGDAGDDTTVAGEPLWWPPNKLCGRYLAPYLSSRTGAAADVMPRSYGELCDRTPRPLARA
jgi:hypothetical protein